MNFPVNPIHRRAWLLATTMFFGAVAIPAGAYVLRDTDPRMEEVTAALPDTKASATVVTKPINVEDVKDLVVAKAAAHGVPNELARAVVQVESDYQASTTGSVGEVGLMQIKYETARILGYTGTLWELYEPETNIEWGMRYLAGARRLADGDLCGTVMRYNGGHGLKRMSRATTIYCNKVKRVLGLPPDPVPVAEARDDGKRKDAPEKSEKKQDTDRNEKVAAKNSKISEKIPVKLAAIAERKAEAPAKNTKTDTKIDTKTSAKIDAKTSTKTAERKPDATQQNSKTQAKAQDTKTAQVNRDKPGDRKVAAAEAKTAAPAKQSKVAELKQETTAKKGKSLEPAGKTTAVSAAAKHPQVAAAKQQPATKNGKPVELADKKATLAAAAKQPKVADAKQEATAKQAKPAEAAAKTVSKTTTKTGAAAATAQASPAPAKSAGRKHDKKQDQSAVTQASASQTAQADLPQAGSAAPVESRIRIADHRVSNE